MFIDYRGITSRTAQNNCKKNYQKSNRRFSTPNEGDCDESSSVTREAEETAVIISKVLAENSSRWFVHIKHSLSSSDQELLVLSSISFVRSQLWYNAYGTLGFRIALFFLMSSFDERVRRYDGVKTSPEHQNQTRLHQKSKK